MSGSNSRTNQYIIIGASIGAVLGALNVLGMALLTFLAFVASSAMPANTPGLGLLWLIIFAGWAYAIAMIWASYAVRKGSKVAWSILVVMFGLTLLSYFVTPRAGLFAIGIVRVAFGLAAVAGFILLIVPPSYRWIWSPEPASALPSYASPGIGRGGWYGAAQGQYPGAAYPAPQPPAYPGQYPAPQPRSDIPPGQYPPGQ